MNGFLELVCYYMWWNYIWHGLPIIGISSAETGLKPAKYSLLLASMYPFLNTFSVFSKISPQPSVLNLKIVRRKKRSSIYIYFPSTLKREKMTSNWILRPVRLLKFVPNWVWVDKSTNRGLGCTRSFPKVPTYTVWKVLQLQKTSNQRRGGGKFWGFFTFKGTVTMLPFSGYTGRLIPMDLPIGFAMIPKAKT